MPSRARRVESSSSDPEPDLFGALAHPARRAVVEFLTEGDAEAGQIADVLWERFHLMGPATSNHLRVLREAGIIGYTATDTYRIYELRKGGLAALCRWVDDYGRRGPPGRRPRHLQRPDPMD